MIKAKTLAALIGVAASWVAMTAQASLVSTAGGLGVYDTVNNVTWIQDGKLFTNQAAGYSGGPSAYVAAVIAASGGVIHDTPNSLDTVPNSGSYTLSASDFVVSFSLMNWWGAKAWVNYLNLTNYAGSNRWALPTTVDSDASYGFPDGVGTNPSQDSSQLAQLFYGGLGQQKLVSILTANNGNIALFNAGNSYFYWADTESSANLSRVWMYSSFQGFNFRAAKNSNYYSAALVSPGNISEVPEPGVALLLSSGLLGVFGLRRRKTQA